MERRKKDMTGSNESNQKKSDGLFNQVVGKRLKDLRLARKMTQTELAKQANITFQQIQKYEKGTNGVSSARLLQLSSFLKVPIKYFFEDYQDFKSSNEENSSSKDINYSFLLRVFSDLEPQQKEKLLDVLGEQKNIKKAI